MTPIWSPSIQAGRSYHRHTDRSPIQHMLSFGLICSRCLAVRNSPTVQ